MFILKIQNVLNSPGYVSTHLSIQRQHIQVGHKSSHNTNNAGPQKTQRNQNDIHFANFSYLLVPIGGKSSGSLISMCCNPTNGDDLSTSLPINFGDFFPERGDENGDECRPFSHLSLRL